MSGDVVDEIAPPSGSLVGAFPARFSRAVGDFSERAFVNLDVLEEAPLEIGPCRWQARDATSLPARGDSCLVLFTPDEEPWVVMWWPFDT